MKIEMLAVSVIDLRLICTGLVDDFPQIGYGIVETPDTAGLIDPGDASTINRRGSKIQHRIDVRSMFAITTCEGSYARFIKPGTLPASKT